MKTSITTSETRIGDTIEMPKFWSVLLVYWDSSATGYSFNDALDTLNNFWPIVEYAEPNYVGSITSLPNDALFTSGEQAGLLSNLLIPNADINIDPAWDITVGRDNTRVGVYDTGINWDHEDFSEDNSLTFSKSRVKGGEDFVNGIDLTTTGTFDGQGHGTACAGIIGAIRNNDRGIAGVAGGNGAINLWGPDLFAMKITQLGFNIDLDDVVNAISQGATSIGSGGFGFHVTNHSWYMTANSKTLSDVVRFAYRNNCVMSVASGNTFDQTALYPSSYKDEWVLKVGANDNTGDRANYSTFGNNLDFIAPGSNDIYATTDATSNNTYTFNEDGTSFSAPHVAGVAALMCSYINSPSAAPNNLAPEDIENLIQKFATDVNSVGVDNETGFGRIDAGATLMGIQMPRFEVKHYSQTFNNNSATKIASGVQISVLARTNGITPGTYTGDIYKVTQTFNITQNSGRLVVDVWPRNSSSTLYGAQPVVDVENCNLVSFNQTTAVMEGFIFDIQTNSLGQGVYRWLPSHGLNGQGTMALTVYSDDPLANSTNKLTLDANSARVVPNPSNGNFSVIFDQKTSENLNIEIKDVNGKVIYSRNLGFITNGQHELNVDDTEFKEGIYMCNIFSKNGSLTKKIVVVK